MPETVQVMIMVDHDISWQPGDLGRLVQKVAETESVVGGVYSKRSFGQSMAIQFAEDCNKLHIYDVTIFQCSLTGQR